jgi:hypothetical protein
MNAKPFKGKYLLPTVLVICFSIALIAWGGQKQPHQQKITAQNITDTLPKTKVDKKIRDLDDVIDELDKAELKVNMDKVNAELEEAMKKIDMDKIKMDVDKAMKEVDMEKIKAEVEKATKEIDVAKIERDIKESIAKVDWDKIKEQMEEVKKVDMSKLDADMKKLEIEMKDLGPKIEKEMQKAKVEIEKAKVEMKEYKGFVDGLDKDGLINKKEGYTIRHKNGELIINGKKQPADVYSKYRSFLEKHTKFNIKKSNDDFNIDTDDDD